MFFALSLLWSLSSSHAGQTGSSMADDFNCMVAISNLDPAPRPDGFSNTHRNTILLTSPAPENDSYLKMTRGMIYQCSLPPGLKSSLQKKQVVFIYEMSGHKSFTGMLEPVLQDGKVTFDYTDAANDSATEFESHCKEALTPTNLDLFRKQALSRLEQLNFKSPPQPIPEERTGISMLKDHIAKHRQMNLEFEDAVKKIVKPKAGAPIVSNFGASNRPETPYDGKTAVSAEAASKIEAKIKACEMTKDQAIRTASRSKIADLKALNQTAATPPPPAPPTATTAAPEGLNRP